MNRATQGVCWGRLFLAQFKGKIAIVVLACQPWFKEFQIKMKGFVLEDFWPLKFFY